MHMLPIVGIIAGKGMLPYSIVETYLKQGGMCYIAALEGEADLGLIKDFTFKTFKVGMVGAMIDYFYKSNVQNIILAGAINRPNLHSVKVDLVGSMLLARIIKQKFLGDDKILRIVADFLEEKGFKVISSNELLTNINRQGVMTTITPTTADMADIELGIKVLHSIGGLDIGQAVIIEEGYVLGIEAAEGTDNLIERCTALRRKKEGGILVKMMKNSQDARLDTPTIGPDTILNLAKYGYKGIALQKDAVIVINQEQTIKLANECKLFIISIPHNCT